MTQQAQAEALLPCPFCGGAAHFDIDDENWEWVECESCGMQGNRSASLMEDCKPKLIEAWNRRAPAHLESQQAVELSEPVAYLCPRGSEAVMPDSFLRDASFEPLYTEQQVRAMVAAPVLGYDSGIQTGNRVTLIFNTQEDATRWFEGFADAYDAAHGTKSIALPVPLAAAPTPPAQERKPLTNEQIAEIASTPCAVVGSYVHSFARAIERAHGIGATNAD